MEIRFQPALLQEVIDSFVEKTEREGDPTYYKEFHEIADPIYEKFTLDDRESEFKKLYQYHHVGMVLDHKGERLCTVRGFSHHQRGSRVRRTSLERRESFHSQRWLQRPRSLPNPLSSQRSSHQS